MQLLVSVRSADEVGPALAGGADIIDAKDPGRGALGAVAPTTITEILARLPGDRPFSVALGDLATEPEIIRAINSLPVAPRPAAVYLKVGFAGVSRSALVSRLLERAVGAARRHPASPLVVAVAYADEADSLPPEEIAQLAAGAGTAGVLLDTHLKNGLGLFRAMAQEEVAAWVMGVQRAGLFAAVAGEIGMTDIEAVQALGADIVGVRGAACEGGREGLVAAERVMSLRLRISRIAFGLPSVGSWSPGVP